MALFKLVNDQGQTATLEAEYFVYDGSGTRLFGLDDTLIAAFGCGQIVSVQPASLVFEGGPEEVTEE